MRILAILAILAIVPSVGAAEVERVPGDWRCSWIANTWPGQGPNGSGQWVQNHCGELDVAADGSVLIHGYWDEAGRCLGLYAADGSRTGRHTIKQYDGKGGHKAWGWGMAGSACAVAGDAIFAANDKPGQLMRFTWTAGDVDSVRFEREVVLAATAQALAARDGRVAVLLPEGVVSLRDATSLEETGGFTIAGARDLAFAPDGDLWLLVDDAVRRYGPDGTDREVALPDVGSPSALTVAPDGRVVVCDDGPRQQVLIYDGGPSPHLVERLGRDGGIDVGVPGRVAPDKLFALRGAALDAAGDLTVAMGFGGPMGGLVVRRFDHQRALRWELHSHGFVHGFTFDPRADGRRVYGPDEIIELELDRTEPGGEWRLAGITLDHVAHPDDPRYSGGKGGRRHGARLRWYDDRRVLFCSGQQAGGFDYWVFPQGDEAHLATHAGRIGNGGWAWQVDAAGDIWHGDAGKEIRRYRFAGFVDGVPSWNQEAPERWPRPAGFTEVCRIHYVPATDTLYVAGYVPEEGAQSWGLIGSRLARIDGWTSGEPVERWRIPLPRGGKQLHPKCLTVAGDYAFTVHVMPTGGKGGVVTVHRLDDGAVVGHMWAEGMASGWIDMFLGLDAIHRDDGEYLILVEEDWRGKQVLHRWRPPGE